MKSNRGLSKKFLMGVSLSLVFMIPSAHSTTFVTPVAVSQLNLPARLAGGSGVAQGVGVVSQDVAVPTGQVAVPTAQPSTIYIGGAPASLPGVPVAQPVLQAGPVGGYGYNSMNNPWGSNPWASLGAQRGFGSGSYNSNISLLLALYAARAQQNQMPGSNGQVTQPFGPEITTPWDSNVAADGSLVTGSDAGVTVVGQGQPVVPSSLAAAVDPSVTFFATPSVANAAGAQ